MQKKINLEEILFIQVDKLRKDFEEIELYSNEEMKSSPEWKYYMEAMKVACKQTLELAAENAKTMPEPMGGMFSEIVDTQSILDTINLIE